VLARRVTVPYLGGLLAVLVLTAIAFAFSYGQLAPLAGSDSPESVLLLVPVAAFVMLAAKLAASSRHGDEAAVNVVFAFPFLLVLAALLVWLPVKLSYFYWVYRLDLLAVPTFLAAAVVLLFGLPALWAARAVFVLLLAGWPPVLDWIVRFLADPIATAQAAIVSGVLSPFHLDIHRFGQTFVFGSGKEAPTLTVSSACSGLVGVFSMALLAGLVACFLNGSTRRKGAWIAVAVVLALLGNLVRLGALVVVGASWGLDDAVGVFHATAGVAIFVAVLVVALLLLRPFQLALPPIELRRADPLSCPGTAVSS
jgi:exosortase